MAETRKYDSSVARIAGNLLSGDPLVSAGGGKRRCHRLLDGNGSMLSQGDQDLIAQAVLIARVIVDEVTRTEPASVQSDAEAGIAVPEVA